MSNNCFQANIDFQALQGQVQSTRSPGARAYQSLYLQLKKALDQWRKHAAEADEHDAPTATHVNRIYGLYWLESAVENFHTLFSGFIGDDDFLAAQSQKRKRAKKAVADDPEPGLVDDNDDE